MAHEGRHDAGLARIVQGMDVCRDSGAILEFPHCWAALADAYGIAGSCTRCHPIPRASRHSRTRWAGPPVSSAIFTGPRVRPSMPDRL